jgi:hypothetical protein
MKAKGTSSVWMVELVIEETSEGETEAKAVVVVGDRRFGGWGRARRNPEDPQLPRVGEELAAARALSDLSHALIDAAVHSIEQREGHTPRVHG